MKQPSYVTAAQALVLFMDGHAPRLNDAAMAALVDVSRTGISKITSGGRNPSLDLAARLENVTGIPASAWQPATDEQGRVSPSWLKIPAKPPTAKPARRPKAVA